MAGEKILVIDPSEQDIRPLVDEVLYPAGYVVVHALDGEEGLRQAMDGNPDLIVAELATPRRSGLDILAQLHEAWATHELLDHHLLDAAGMVQEFVYPEGKISIDLGERRYRIEGGPVATDGWVAAGMG